VAIDVTPLSRPGADRGLGRYTRAVLGAAQQQRFRVKPVRLPRRGGRAQYVVDLVDRQRRLRRMEYDVFHATSPYMNALCSQGRHVVSVLDLIPLELRDYRRIGLNANFFLRTLVPRADRILALSRFTANRVATILEVPKEKIVVASLPPAASFTPRSPRDSAQWLLRHGIRPPFIAAVTDGRTHDPRKRSEWLPAIGKSLGKAGCQLVVAGPATRELFRADGCVTALGRVTDEELACLFGAAHGFVYTSAYEGQGLPPLEAMACGTPVVAMRNSAIEECVGGGGILIDETAGTSLTAVEELAEACIALVHDDGDRDELTGRALRQSSRFTLTAFGAALARAYAG
jgi:glycosyltransferase involved in cell wall biosynthesis